MLQQLPCRRAVSWKQVDTADLGRTAHLQIVEDAAITVVSQWVGLAKQDSTVLT